MADLDWKKLAKQDHLAEEDMAKMSDADYQKWRFLRSRDVSNLTNYGGAVPYYPQQRYIEKNLAPELGVTHTQLEALAHANQIARKNGLMSNNLADKMLPTLLTEGASGARWGYPDTPKYRSILEKAGLPSTLDEINLPAGSTKYDQELLKAKMMHAVMAAKAKDYGEDLATERWNGKGVGVGKFAGVADAKNHARKVEELNTLLQHPKNKELMDTWNMYSQRYAGGQSPQELRQAPPISNWEDENLPAGLGYLVTKARNALPDISLHDVQDTIRNWTAPTTPVVDSKKKGGAVKMPDNYKQGSWKII